MESQIDYRRFQYFTTPWQSEMLKLADTWFLDIYDLKLTHRLVYKLITLIIQDPQTRVFIPCFFGIFQARSQELYTAIFRRYLRAIDSLTDNQCNPKYIIADYNVYIRSALRERFPNSLIIGSFYHRNRMVKDQIIQRRGKNSMQAAMINAYLLVLSLLTVDSIIEEFSSGYPRQLLSNHIKGLQFYTQNFVESSGAFHHELSFRPYMQEKFFQAATPALEGCRNRLARSLKLNKFYTKKEFVQCVLKSQSSFSASRKEYLEESGETGHSPEIISYDIGQDLLQISLTQVRILGRMHCLTPIELARSLLNRQTEIGGMKDENTSLCDFDNFLPIELPVKRCVKDEDRVNYV